MDTTPEKYKKTSNHQRHFILHLHLKFLVLSNSKYLSGDVLFICQKELVLRLLYAIYLHRKPSDPVQGAIYSKRNGYFHPHEG